MTESRVPGADSDDDFEPAEPLRDAGWIDQFVEEDLPAIPSYTVEPGGVVYLVGAGPGDPGLLTVRGRELLDVCDVIVYDALVDPSLLQRRDATRPPPELLDVGKRGGDPKSARQDDINAMLIRLARDGKSVVRLKGGDPFIFGRGSEEAQALAEAGVQFEVIPGITAGIAAPAYAGIPVTHRGLATSVTFVTGHEDPEKPGTQTNWAALAQAGGTLVLYMGVKRLPAIARALTANGLPAEIPAAAIEWGTYGRQRTITATLGTLTDASREAGLQAPVIVVIGWSVVLRDEIAWFDRRPLFGYRIVVTRPAQGSGLADRLRSLGADVLSVPATRIEPLNYTALDEAISTIEDYQWMVFTSRNAVRYVWERLRQAQLDARALAGMRIAVIGSATAAALLEYGIVADVVPERFVGEGVIEALRLRGDVDGARVLYATAEGARDVLPNGLAELGAEVDMIPIYRSVPDDTGAEPLRLTLEADEVDLITFTSASTVDGFVRAVGPDAAARAPAVSIGPVTSTAAREAGLEVVAEGDPSTIDGLVSAVLAWARVNAPRRLSGHAVRAALGAAPPLIGDDS